MLKRLIAGVLWFYVMWDAWCFLAAFLGLPATPGPVFGAVAALLIAGDPLHRIWGGRSARPPAMPATAPQSEPA